MLKSPDESTAPGGGGPCLVISLQSVASKILASDGRDIPFNRAILTINNVCSAEVIDLVPHASLGQEGGTVQDVTNALLARLQHRSLPVDSPAGTCTIFFFLLTLAPPARSTCSGTGRL